MVHGRQLHSSKRWQGSWGMLAVAWCRSRTTDIFFSVYVLDIYSPYLALWLLSSFWPLLIKCAMQNNQSSDWPGLYPMMFGSQRGRVEPTKFLSYGVKGHRVWFIWWWLLGLSNDDANWRFLGHIQDEQIRPSWSGGRDEGADGDAERSRGETMPILIWTAALLLIPLGLGSFLVGPWFHEVLLCPLKKLLTIWTSFSGFLATKDYWPERHNT